MIRPFLVVGYIFIGVSSILLLLGLWTFTFNETVGTLINSGKRDIQMTGSYTGIGQGSRGAQFAKLPYVDYKYQIHGTEYHSTRIGMGLSHWTLSPFSKMAWENQSNSDDTLQVYHSQKWPHISVLHQGIDIVFTFIFAILGIALIRFSRWLFSH